ncbi:hypothetical protein MACH17_09270 [Phaeobacter inhibens]|nr:hypothetical protein MACH17_09270 [Phaeobacter inhibens]
MVRAISERHRVRLMSLGRYPSDVRAIADELIVLLEGEYPNETAQIAATRGAAAI